ncbi:hypothetical protein L1987_46152 [Smallanthus sonchifolius]|uniref:Uncharacterized protein n=1 Tax=Smallanthus sonchifolius TaxID=185202 RepID=A0ACB9FZY7_9ASTR|nr:hypothetical protein L1987_46152 [Smallanthus sonchifolius]
MPCTEGFALSTANPYGRTKVRDLLTGYSASTSKLEIRSCTSENGLSLPVATIHSVKSTADVLNLMKSSLVNRAVSSTTLNHQSSWSHTFLSLTLRNLHGFDSKRMALLSYNFCLAN